MAEIKRRAGSFPDKRERGGLQKEGSGGPAEGLKGEERALGGRMRCWEATC